MRHKDDTRTGIDRRNKTPRGTSAHAGRHPYVRDGFWQDSANHFWEHSHGGIGHSPASKMYFRELYQTRP